MKFGSDALCGGAGRRRPLGRRAGALLGATTLALALVASACGTGTVDRGVDPLETNLSVPTTASTRQAAATTRGSTATTSSPESTANTGATSSQPSAFAPVSVTVPRGQPAELVLDTGASITIPPGAITSPDALVTLRQVGPNAYEPSIDGTWNPPIQLNLPVGSASASSWTFFMHQTRGGWSVDRAALEPTTTISHDLTELSVVRALSCTEPRSAATHVLLCLTDAQVTQLPIDVAGQLAAGLGCAEVWPINNLLFQTEYCDGIGASPTTAPATPATLRPLTTDPTDTTNPTVQPGGSLSVTLSENPFVCNGTSRVFGTLSGALPGEGLSFSSPQVGGLLPGLADGNGNKTLRWYCDPASAGATWSLTAVGQSSGRSVTFSFTGAAPPTTVTEPTTPTPTTGATTASVSLYENPFLCNGERRPFGTVVGLVPGETVRITSTTVRGLNPGTADENGNMTVNWRCDVGAKGSVWSLTATGNTSGRSVTFAFSGY